MKTIQIKIDLLKKIVQEAETMKSHDSSLSDTLLFTVIHSTETHLGNDRIAVELKSGYSECIGKSIVI